MESKAPDTEALRRCGESTTRLFCGGTHVVIGIRAAQKTVRREEEEV